MTYSWRRRTSVGELEEEGKRLKKELQAAPGKIYETI
jgi:hypothetical protein